MKKQLIICPECNIVELGTINTSTFPWNTLIHNCSCGYVIMESEWERVKALSIKQPWAWLIVNGYKDIENRNTLKNFRGIFLIHASRKFDVDGFAWILKNRNLLDMNIGKLPKQINKNLNIPSSELENVKKYELGGIIGYAEIYDCVTESDSPWFVGKYGLMIRNPVALPFTPCKGKLSFFYPEID